MNSISTKKKNLVTNSNTRKSKKKSRYQYGGSSDVLQKISNRKVQKSVPSEMSSISSQDFSSMSLDQKKAVLAERKRAIRSKKLEERKKKRKLKRERSRLRTQKQRALREKKLAREKAKKQRTQERKKSRKEKEKEKEGVTQGVQQMAMVPGMGMQQPYGMAQGLQTGMLPMGMSPAMIQGMALTGMGAPGQFQIAPGSTSIASIDESSLEEMVSMLKNFEGNDYEQTSRLILTEDVYTTFNTAFNKLQQVIETVYKINQDTLNKAIKDRLDRDIEKRKAVYDKAVKAERREKQLEHQRLENEASRRNGLFKMAQQTRSLISKPAKQEAEESIVAEINYNLVRRLMEFLILYAKYPELFILSKHMKLFETPIEDIKRERDQTSKPRKPNIFATVQLSTELLQRDEANNVSATGQGGQPEGAQGDQKLEAASIGVENQIQQGGNPLRVSHNDGSVELGGQSFSQQCFWISIVDWLMFKSMAGKLPNTEIFNQFSFDKGKEGFMVAHRVEFLSKIKSLTTMNGNLYGNIIKDNEQTYVEGNDRHKEVIQDFVNKTGLYIDVFNINLKDNTKLLVPRGKEKDNLRQLSSLYTYTPDPQSETQYQTPGQEDYSNRIFIVAYGNHFELITGYNDYYLVNDGEKDINEGILRIMLGIPKWTYAIYPEDKPSKLIDAQNIDDLSAEEIAVLFNSLVTVIEKILNTSRESPNEQQKQKQKDQLLNLGHQFGVMLEQLKTSDKQELYTQYQTMYYGEGGTKEAPKDDSLLNQITILTTEDSEVTDEEPALNLKQLLNKKQEEFKTQISRLSVSQELKTEILRKLSSVIREYISKYGTTNILNLENGLQNTIKLQLNEQLAQYFTTDGISQSNKINLSDLDRITFEIIEILETYMKIHNITPQAQSPELNGKFDPFYLFLGGLVDSPS